MKNIIGTIIMLICAVSIVLINLEYNKIDSIKEPPFMNINWTRTTEVDTEFISFSDGHFSYYCSCGNPVNDSDLCDKYTYDYDNETINLECIEELKNTITKIKVVEYDEDTLVLDFNGDIRTFTKEVEEVIE